MPLSNYFRQAPLAVYADRYENSVRVSPEDHRVIRHSELRTPNSELRTPNSELRTPHSGYQGRSPLPSWNTGARYSSIHGVLAPMAINTSQG